jgi:hypothetical protein
MRLRTVFLFAALVSLGGCNARGTGFRGKAEWKYDTTGAFSMSCKRAVFWPFKLPSYADVEFNMKKAHSSICGVADPIGHFYYNSKIRVPGHSDFSASYEFKCAPTDEVMNGAKAFKINQFCMSLNKPEPA